jgi:hypothetical protein
VDLKRGLEKFSLQFSEPVKKSPQYKTRANRDVYAGGPTRWVKRDAQVTQRDFFTGSQYQSAVFTLLSLLLELKTEN